MSSRKIPTKTPEQEIIDVVKNLERKLDKFDEGPEGKTIRTCDKKIDAMNKEIAELNTTKKKYVDARAEIQISLDKARINACGFYLPVYPYTPSVRCISPEPEHEPEPVVVPIQIPEPVVDETIINPEIILMRSFTPDIQESHQSSITNPAPEDVAKQFLRKNKGFNRLMNGKYSLI